MKLSIEKLRPISIGHSQDNETGVIWVDCSDWLDKYPMLTTYAIAVTRPDGEIYFAPAVMSDEGWLEWVISTADTAAYGSGMYQIIATGADGQRRATDYFPLYIYPNMPGLEDASPEPPEAARGWVDRVLGAAAEAKDNADAAWQGAAEANEAAAEAKAQADRAQKIVDGFSPEGGSGGTDGGYYKPSISPEGMLSWTPSKAGMPDVESMNVRGEAGKDGKSAYQYAVEGGYAGSEAEFAAKLAEESYTLPTATANVKGGVKIGDGLEMDGEALRVKDEEYELIQTIEVGKTVDALQTDIVQLKRALILVVAPKVDSACSVTLNINAGTWIMNLYAYQYARNDGERYCAFEIKPEYGYWTGYYISSANGKSTVGTVQRVPGYAAQVILADHPALTRFTFNGTIPAGTIIRLMGVRGENV